MFESDKRSPLDRLRKGLYSRNSGEAYTPRHDIHGGNLDVAESWDRPEKKESEEVHLTPKRRSAYKVVFIFSALFLVVAVAVTAYTFLSGGNLVSVDNVDILVEGPATVAGGNQLDLDVTVSNKNQTGIQLVDLVVDYPQGTKDPANPTNDLTEQRLSLGNINSQSIAQQTISSIMFGQQGDVKEIKLTAEYRTADSNAVFFKNKVYDVTISSSPVNVSVNSLDKVLGGEPFDMTVTVSSNSTTPVKGLLLSLDYPSGLSVVSAAPAATYNDNIWLLGDLAPGVSRTIKLSVTASGQDGEDKTVHANVGIQSQANEREIGTTIVSQDSTFTIEKPFLGLDIALDGQRADLATTAGHVVHGDVLWTNNSTSQITNAKIVAQLSGNVLDQNSVTVDEGGYYSSLTNSITWDSGHTSAFQTIAPGDNGRVSFTISSSVPVPGQSILNPEMTVAVSAQGSRLDETGAPQAVNTAITRSVKLASNLSLSASAVYSQGPFQNSGPISPKVNQATTYTVIWTVTNTSNIITGAKVTATLPQYVKWTGQISPSDASVSYDSNTGNIIWNVGDVAQNADIGSGAKQVSFQVSLTPSANQVGAVPNLVGQETITGTDVFTGATVQNTAQSLTTKTTTDILYKPGDESVQQ